MGWREGEGESEGEADAKTTQPQPTFSCIRTPTKLDLLHLNLILDIHKT